jgi:hypothetical protein
MCVRVCECECVRKFGIDFIKIETFLGRLRESICKLLEKELSEKST